MRTLLALGLLLAGCAATPEPPPPPGPPAALLDTRPSPPLTTATTAAAVVKHFDAAKARELTVVLTAPTITRAQIEAIHAADHRARQALTHLGRELPHPTRSTMDEARLAVRALEDALEAP
jgi:hypothetical protein